VLVDHLPSDFPPSEAKRLQQLVGDKLSAPQMGLEKFGLHLVTAAARDRIMETLASGKLAADGPTCRFPASAGNVIEKADAPADLAVARVYVTKEQLVVEVRVGAMWNARSIVLASKIEGDGNVGRAVAKLDYDSSARAPLDVAPVQKDAYLDELCTFGLRPSINFRMITGVDHAPLPIAKIHRCAPRGSTSIADVSIDLAADGQIERLRVYGVDAKVAACLESVLREVPFSCPIAAGTTGGKLEIATSSVNVPGCAGTLRQL
jgi:hypothetical protein